MPGRKTHEQQVRMFERKPDVPDARATEAAMKHVGQDAANIPKRDIRQSEFPVSHQGMNQESEHNKHNHPKKGARKHRDGSSEDNT
jgi:hypothetical protein